MLVVVATIGALAAAAQGVIRDDEPDRSEDVSDDAVVDPALAGYLERVAEHGADVPVVDAELPPECDDGEVLWHRDGEIDICAPLCSTDDDCVVGFERCAALVIPGVVEPIAAEELEVDENGEAIPAEARTFVDDDEVAVERVEAGQAIAVCDPFFDLHGATSEAEF